MGRTFTFDCQRDSQSVEDLRVGCGRGGGCREQRMLLKMLLYVDSRTSQTRASSGVVLYIL